MHDIPMRDPVLVQESKALLEYVVENILASVLNVIGDYAHADLK